MVRGTEKSGAGAKLASGMAGSRGSIYVMGLDFSTLTSAFLPTGFILKQGCSMWGPQLLCLACRECSPTQQQASFRGQAATSNTLSLS